MALPGADVAAPTFEQLFHTQRPALVRLAVLLVDEVPLAEDIVQEAFAELHARLPGFGAGGCHRAGTGSTLDVGDATASLQPWACGDQRYEQVTLQSRMLLAVAPVRTGTTIRAALRTVRQDPAYARDYVVHDCRDVALGSDGDDVASRVRAAGVRCAEANALVLELAALTGPVSGPSAVDRLGGPAPSCARTPTCRRPR
jgi:hypothetical protein